MKLSIDGARAVISAGTSGICRQVAELFIQNNARVFIINAIVPGLVEGDRMERVIRNEASAKGISSDEVRETFIKGISMHKFVTAKDIAHMILFLCSDAGRYISGQSIGVDGYTEILR